MSEAIHTKPELIAEFLQRFPGAKVIHKNTLFYDQFYYRVCYKVENAYRLVSQTDFYTKLPSQYAKKENNITEKIAQQIAINTLRDAGKCRTICHGRHAFSLFFNDLGVVSSLALVGLGPEIENFNQSMQPKVIGSIMPKGKIRVRGSKYKFRCYLKPLRVVDHSVTKFLSELDPKIGQANESLKRPSYAYSKHGLVYLPQKSYVDIYNAEHVTFLTLAGTPIDKIFEIVSA